MQVQNNQFKLVAPKANNAPKKNQEAKAPAAASGEQFSQGVATDPTLSKPNFEETKSSGPKPAELTDNPEAAGLKGWQKTIMMGMAGITLLGATGCVKQDPGTGTSTSSETEAMKQLNSTFDNITKSVKEDGNQSHEAVAGKMLNAIAEYSRATGEKGNELMDNVGGTIRKNPVLAASLAFAAGSAVGIGLDQFGVTDSAVETAGDVVDWVKENPIKSIAVGVAVAGAGYLIYDNLIKPMAEVPEAPTGEHAEAMEKTFESLEKELQNHDGNPQEKAAQVSLTLTQKIKEYAQATGRSAAEVRNDVMAWSYEHPIVATSLVAGAGVATGILLSQAGVPEHVAQFAGVALDVGGQGLDSVTEFAKENPVVAGVVTAGIAAGAGYLIYQAVNANAAQ